MIVQDKIPSPGIDSPVNDVVHFWTKSNNKDFKKGFEMESSSLLGDGCHRQFHPPPPQIICENSRVTSNEDVKCRKFYLYKGKI